MYLGLGSQSPYDAGWSNEGRGENADVSEDIAMFILGC